MRHPPNHSATPATLKHSLLVLALLGIAALASPAWAESQGLEVVNLQLRWHHQFQFAGYYAALEQGYYREAGLDVRIHAGAPGRTPIEEVLSGRAQYGEANSELLYQRLMGKPLVALASIFQHSPSILLARSDSGILSPQDMKGKRVMLIGDITDADFQAMFQNEGVALATLQIQPSSYNIEDLVTGKTDAFNAYLTNEPYYLQQRRVPYTIIDPRRYGIDFYSDILFTTEQELRDHPDRVQAFRKASLKGWEYAMDHPDLIIDLLIDKYGVTKSRAHLIYEATAMRGLILPDLIEIGHMNPSRWRHMADTFVKVGMLQPDYSLEGFLYDPDPTVELARLKRIATIAILVIVVLGLLTAIFYGLYMKLRREVALREQAERRIRELAYYDSLTQLPNRNLFYDRLNHAIAQATRSEGGFALCFIDLDGFKHINDQYGHMAGDELLQAVATRLRETVRESDTVARFGGDEFVVLLEDVTTTADVEHLTQVLLNAIRQPYILNEKPVLISSSIGVTLYPEDEQNIRDLLTSADAAMYQSKQAGKNRVVLSRDVKRAGTN